MRIIAFAGSKGAGKDTAARSLLTRNTLVRPGLFVQHNFADSLKQVVEIIFGFTHKELHDPALKELVPDKWPHIAPRTVLQNVAKTFRTMYSADIWVRAWFRRLKLLTASCIVVTDLRHIEELELLQRLGAKIIYIDNPIVAEARRKGIEAGDPMWLDDSEAFTEHLKLQADLIIVNDSDLNTLHSRTQTAVLELFGDWTEWSEVNMSTNKELEDIIL